MTHNSACPCMSDCFEGCEDCPNPVCVSEKAVLVLSTRTPLHEQILSQPMLIQFDGEYTFLSFLDALLEINSNQFENSPKKFKTNSGEYREASFAYGNETSVYYSCPIEFKGQFLVFGGKGDERQVRI